MGVWGAGLYSGDFAKDLRASIAAVSRLPYDGSKLVEILCDLEPGPANNPADEDFTTFWLVLADQFSRRGIVERTVRERALQIIGDDSDVKKLKDLGMAESELGKRRRILSDLKISLTSPDATQRRAVLKKPQPFIVEIGEAFAYPTCQGKCINPYLSLKSRIPGWKQDLWGVAIMIDRGRAFDFLAWYRPLTIANAVVNLPRAEFFVDPDRIWILRKPGTLSVLHYRRMELQKISSLPINKEKLARAFPSMSPGTYQAVNDISIANELSIGPSRDLRAEVYPFPRISGIGKIVD